MIFSLYLTILYHNCELTSCNSSFFLRTARYKLAKKNSELSQLPFIFFDPVAETSFHKSMMSVYPVMYSCIMQYIKA